MDYGEVEIELPDETIKAIGKVYEQLLEPSAEELGDNLKILPEIINNFAHSIHMKRLTKKHEYQMADLCYKKIPPVWLKLTALP